MAGMHRDWLLALLLGSVIANGRAGDACSPQVGHWKYDLTRMMSSDALEYKDPGQSYAATICTSAKLDQVCSIVGDATAVEEGSCSVHGRASSAGSYEYLDPNDPTAGVKILYAGGSPCPALVDATYSVWFDIHCNSEINDLSKSFVKVTTDDLGEPCVYKYSFQWAGACPVEVNHHGGSKGGVSAAVWVPILLICLTFAYCAGGSFYKRYKYGSSGIESIPHIDALRFVYARCVEMCCPSWAPETSDRYKPLMDLSDENDMDYERTGGVSLRGSGEDTVIKFMRT